MRGAGIGPAIAARIVEKFGDRTMELLNRTDGSGWDELTRVKGVSKALASRLKQDWQTHAVNQSLILFLQTHGLSLTFADKLLEAYGGDAVTVLEQQPYRLTYDIRGIGFVTADRIAAKLGMDATQPARLEAAIVFAMQQGSSQGGHCFLTQAQLLRRTVAALGPPPPAITRDSEAHYHRNTAPPPTNRTEERERWNDAVLAAWRPHLLQALDSLCKARRLVCERTATMDETAADRDDSLVYTAAYLYDAEQVVAQTVRYLASMTPSDLPSPPDPQLSPLNAEEADAEAGASGVRLSAEQQYAVELASCAPLSVLTGGPGTGKTLTTRSIVERWVSQGKRVVLACPTARAAHRLNEVLGPRLGCAVTIHRLLEYGPFASRARAARSSDGSSSSAIPQTSSPFGRCRTNPLDADCILVDEASMLDLELSAALMNALPLPRDVNGALQQHVDPSIPPPHLLIVGDCDQLPSVGAGRIMADLLACDRVPSVRLTHVFRQAASSSIVTNAHAVNHGHVPSVFRRLPELPASYAIPPFIPSSMMGDGAGSGTGSVSDELEAEDGQSDGESEGEGAAGEEEGMEGGEELVGDDDSEFGRYSRLVFGEELSAVGQGTDSIIVSASDMLDGDDAGGGTGGVGGRCLHEVLDLVRRMGLSPLDDLTVLAPMRKGAMGTGSWNEALQRELNPAAAKPHSPWVYLVGGRATLGDKVMQTSNSYDKGVINGDVGRVVKIDPSQGRVWVRFDGVDASGTSGVRRTAGGGAVVAGGDEAARLHLNLPAVAPIGSLVSYTRSEARQQLHLAYAVTVHKAQGTEWPVVVVALHQSQYVMLNRRLLYTALARAQRLVVLVTSKQALRLAVVRDADDDRQSLLRDRIEEAGGIVGVSSPSALECVSGARPGSEEGVSAMGVDPSDVWDGRMEGLEAVSVGEHVMDYGSVLEPSDPLEEARGVGGGGRVFPGVLSYESYRPSELVSGRGEGGGGGEGLGRMRELWGELGMEEELCRLLEREGRGR